MSFFLASFFLQKETTFQSQGEQMRSSTEPKYYVSLVTLGDPLTIISMFIDH